MKKIYFLFLFSLFSGFLASALAQAPGTAKAKYSLVRVFLDEHKSIGQLAALGLECDHGRYAPGRFLENVFSEDEIERIRRAGFSFEVRIDDMVSHYHAHRHDPAPGTVSGRSADCGKSAQTNWVTPSNYTYGSMGGYHTWDQLKTVLDDMRTKFPGLVSAKAPIGNSLLTKEGRPIYWLRISDNPDQDEPEPEVLYTALHHAREPNSLSQLLFYMWYLLENYDSDPEIKALVDNTEMYFIPCINPDGYVYNQTTEPSGGGQWRKNRGSNGGVDLNRNYGDHWGFDDLGSSPNASDDTYRGPSAFSEAETQAVKLFCEAHEFKIALNAHTFSNLLIYPYGYNNQPTPDHTTFVEISELMVEQNLFLNGLASETVGYAANGDSDDWMYTETPEKAKIFAMTPEIGPFEMMFWPPQSAIDALNKSMMWMNLTAARIQHNFGIVSAVPGPVSGLDAKLAFKVKRYGFADGNLSVSLNAQSANVTATGASKTFALAPFATAEDEIGFTLSPSIADGDEIVLLLSINNGIWTHTDTVRLEWQGTAQSPLSVIFEDPGANLSQWTASGGWGVSTAQYVSAPSSIADSPAGQYEVNLTSQLNLTNPIDLTGATAARLSFFARWDIEKGYDFVQLLGSSNGSTFTPLCGIHTATGTSFQDEGQPLYDGTQTEWVEESIDLKDYLGGKLWLLFRLYSDPFATGDGFYFDDIVVKAALAPTPVTDLAHGDTPALSITPNPAVDAVDLNIGFPTGHTAPLRLSVCNALGIEVFAQETVDASTGTRIRLNVHNWPQGLYFVRLERAGSGPVVRRLSVSR